MILPRKYIENHEKRDYQWSGITVNFIYRMHKVNKLFVILL